MIYVTDVSQYAFCPYSIYLRKIHKIRVVTPPMIFGDIYHRITERMEKRERVIFDIFVREGMGADEITTIFYDDTKKVIRNAVLRNKKRIKEDILKTIERLNQLFLRRSMEKAVLLRKAMDSYGKKDIYDIVFPEALTELSIASKKLNLCGRIDRVEEKDKKYYPVEIKTSTAEKYMEKDVLQLAGYALLLESKFGNPVDKGFIEYVVLNKKYEIEIDRNLKNDVLKIKTSVEEILNGNIPEKKRREECDFCNLHDICWGTERSYVHS
ncbi:MAG: CRISPR-associated protein Cas4 [Methanomicrobia archaeon]|nr:CRISPR-associated protein Cas4 [Methanomicrobia archaeon]